MDNKQFDIVGRSDRQLELAIEIAFTDEYSLNSAIGYEIKDGRFILYSAAHKDMIKTPFPMNFKFAISMIKEWLKITEPRTKEPNTDGSTALGFRVYCESWGHVDGKWEAFAAIEPIWLVYGK